MAYPKRTHCKRGHEFTEENTYNNPQGYRACRTCLRDLNKKYMTKEERARYAKNWRKDNPEKLWQKLHPERYKKSQRRIDLKKVGWTLEVFNSTLAEQQGKCAICQKELTSKSPETRGCADHEHITPPKPRGVLCHSCNLGIGNLQENVDIMRAAIAYVEKWRYSGT